MIIDHVNAEYAVMANWKETEVEGVVEEWRVYGKSADFKAIGEKYKIDQVVARVIRNRDIVTPQQYEEYINGDLSSLHSPWLLKDMDRAAQLVKSAIDNNETIRIVGDYDIDGINSIYILYSGLKRLGADVDYVVPHRVTDGYGINERLIDEAYDEGRQVIITCDNGIAAYSQIEHAKALGMTVVVTDHHGVPFEEKAGEKTEILPPADAVVDPARADCTYPWKKICGAVVGMKLVQALYELYKRPENEIYDFLEFAAIATVGDVVDLQGENRTIVRLGLKKIKNSNNRGLNALIDLNKLDRARITSYHVGFVIGPCLNASGRLESAMLAIRMLLATDKGEAEHLAGELAALNEERKELTRQGVEKAFDMIDNSSLKDDKVLVVYLPGCHESIVGIIAGKIRERYNKPVIVFADGEGCLKGSGRSIEAYNMFEKLTQCKELLLKFGGHPMAAGMSIEPDKLDELRRKLNEYCGLTEEDLILKVWIDVPMPLEYISEKVIDDLSVLEPLGKGNEKPVFADTGLQIKNLSHIGKERQFTKVIFSKQAQFVDSIGKPFVSEITMEAVMFSINEVLENAYAAGNKVNVLYYPSVNEFNGNRKLQIVLSSVKVCRE